MIKRLRHSFHTKAGRATVANGDNNMMNDVEGTKQTGRFIVSPGTDIYGELTLAGAKTSLYLHDKEDFNTHAIPDQRVNAIASRT